MTIPLSEPPMRLQVDVTSGSMASLQRLILERAQEFFGDEKFWLESPVEVDVEEEVTVQGVVTQRWYAGRAYFVNYREVDV